MTKCQGCKPQTNVVGIAGAIGSGQTHFSFTKHTCEKGEDAPITVHIPASSIGIKILETKDNQIIRYE